MDSILKDFKLTGFTRLLGFFHFQFPDETENIQSPSAKYFMIDHNNVLKLYFGNMEGDRNLFFRRRRIEYPNFLLES